MPLYACSKCGCVDNTALGGYWKRVYLDKLPPLCSECNPEIGKWHGDFPKDKIDKIETDCTGKKYRYVLDESGGRTGMLATVEFDTPGQLLAQQRRKTRALKNTKKL